MRDQCLRSVQSNNFQVFCLSDSQLNTWQSCCYGLCGPHAAYHIGFCFPELILSCSSLSILCMPSLRCEGCASGYGTPMKTLVCPFC